MTKQWCVPMFESERGWGNKIDGYAGPFETQELALKFQYDYNAKYNNQEDTPDWYLMALAPEVLTHQLCEYLTTVE